MKVIEITSREITQPFRIMCRGSYNLTGIIRLLVCQRGDNCTTLKFVPRENLSSEDFLFQQQQRKPKRLWPLEAFNRDNNLLDYITTGCKYSELMIKLIVSDIVSLTAL